MLPRQTSLRLARAGQVCGLHDLAKISSTGKHKPMISYGPPGRSAVTGHIATVFGCTGFLGRYLVAKLAKAGTQVIVPYRDEDEKRHLKVMGDLGQIVSLEWDLRNDSQIEESVRHSDIVYNLVGRDYETKNFSFKAVHVDGAEKIAAAAAAHNVARLVHVSHLNVDVSSTSAFYSSKAEGEEKVRAAYPNATIIRPGPMFGGEDRLIQNMAFWPIWWKLNDGRTRIRPVYVQDVAEALARLIYRPSVPRTLSLPGPQSYSYEYLLELISSVTYRPPSRAPVMSKAIAKLLARSAQSVWWPLVSPDEVERRYINDADTPGDWEIFDIVPDELEFHALALLRRFRSSDDYVRPLVLPSRSDDTYRVVE